MFVVEVLAAILITVSLVAMVNVDTRDNRVRVIRSPVRDGVERVKARAYSGQ